MTTILVVEDDTMNRELLERLLAIHGYQVISAADGAKGLAMARTHQPDLIIMDMGLPVLNGWQATNRLKNTPATRHIPVIALTAYAFTEDRERCMAVGCDDYDVKPLDAGRLLMKIQFQLAQIEANNRARAVADLPSLSGGADLC
ncbi:MAG: response regulator [Oscillochloris sp.]|nr:response regulator [Oscillochloris sp.]